MPYIKPEDREKFDAIAKEISDSCQSVGEINYAITSIIHNYIRRNGMSYTNVNELIGVLECAKLELYRAVAAPYEDIKIEENGYVSDIDNAHHVTLFRKPL